MTAPAQADENVILEAEKLAHECQKHQDVNPPSEPGITFVGKEEFIDQSESLAERAREAKDNTGWM